MSSRPSPGRNVSGEGKSKIILLMALGRGSLGVSLGLLRSYQSTQVTRTNKTHVDDGCPVQQSKVLPQQKIIGNRTDLSGAHLYWTDKDRLMKTVGPSTVQTDKKIYDAVSFRQGIDHQMPTKSATTYK